MAYTPTNWSAGDTITAEKLNNMEGGIAENDGYWIPLEITAEGFAVPADKQGEVSFKLINEFYYIRGCRFSGGGDLAGYRVASYKFYCPFSSEAAANFGVHGPGNLVVSHADGGAVSVEIVPDVFVITFTPTAEDFSGTMDKTPQEILNAYKANRRICAKILGIYGAEYTDLWAFMTSAIFYDHPNPEISDVSVNFEFVINYGDNTFLVQATTDHAISVYSTRVFPLTPMS